MAPLRLDWPGRTFRAGAVTLPTVVCKPHGPAILERIGDERHRVLFGDAESNAQALLAEGLGGHVDLVYVDPPFASQADYVHEARLDGPANGRVVRTTAYSDTWATEGGDLGIGRYLDALAPRLELLSLLLSPRGVLWVHLDWRASYLVRVVLDEILGRDAFKNEIVWRRAPNLGRQAASGQFGRTLDTLLVYGKPEAVIRPPTRLKPIDDKAVRFDPEGRAFTTAPRGDYTDASIERLEKEGRVHRTASGRIYIKYFLVKDREGRWARERRVDTLWTDVPPLRHVATSERTGFPTQKPRALLERIIAASTERDALVVDLFAGSGTTGEAAHVLGRRAIVGDVGPMALSTIRARYMRAGMGFRIESPTAMTTPVAPPPIVHVAPAGPGEARVTLEEPADVLAWAVDGDFDADYGFEAEFHAERSLGARPKPPVREGVVKTDREAPLVVRVYLDDGRVGEAVLAAGALPAERAAEAVETDEKHALEIGDEVP